MSDEHKVHITVKALKRLTVAQAGVSNVIPSCPVHGLPSPGGQS